jgi:O-antigen/teichoic acid export membrane protein
MCCAAVPVAAGIALFPRQIMSAFGAEFSDGAMLLVILSLGQLVNVISGSVNALLSMCGFESDLRNILLTSGGFAILLSVVLTRTYGVQGTAIATAVALVVQNIYAVWIVKKRLGFSMFSAISELRRTARQAG